MKLTIDTINSDEAERLCRAITKALPDYFGLPEVNEHYALGVKSRTNMAAKIGNDFIGLLSIEYPYPNNCSIYWMALFPEYHGQGIGTQMLDCASLLARQNHAKTMTVETLAPEESDLNYSKTYQFYLKNGFNPLMNLKPQNYEWYMVYMLKDISKANAKYGVNNATIRKMEHQDVAPTVEAFAQAHWSKPASLFEHYLKEQEEGKRVVWLASVEGQVAGYVTLNFDSKYQPFKQAALPEIMDFNVLPHFQEQGIGAKMLDLAEAEAAKKHKAVGIGVGLYADYGQAQKT